MVLMRSAPRHSISTNTNDLQNLFPNARVSFLSSSTTGSLQFLNIRVTQRLQRYRLLKRQWDELTTTVQSKFSSTPNFESSSPVERKGSDLNDYITRIGSTRTKETREKIFNELDPLHSQIREDIFQLRGLIRERQKKLAESLSLKENTNKKPSRELTSMNMPMANQDDNNNNTTTIRRSSSVNRITQLDCMRVSGCRIRSAIFPQSNSVDSGIGTTSNSSSMCSQYSQRPRKIEQQTNNKIDSICHSRVVSSLPADSIILGVPPPRQTSKIQRKTIQNTCLKRTQSLYLPVTPVLTKKQASIIKPETPSPPVDSPSDTEEPTTCLYTHAASTSSTIPDSMKLNRDTSSLPILFTSSSCLGIQPEETHLKTRKENRTDYHNLLDYQTLLNHLSKPIISIHSQYNQDGYGILFAQLDHIRETMPNSNVYNDYTRTC